MGDSKPTGTQQKQTFTGPNGTPITTKYVFPPIPTRSLDWCAWYDPPGNEWDGDPEAEPDIGWGPTEQSAIADLIRNYEEPTNG